MLDLKKSIQRMQPYRQGDVFSATDVCNAFSCAAHRVCAVTALNALHELADEGVLNVIKRQSEGPYSRQMTRFYRPSRAAMLLKQRWDRHLKLEFCA